MKRIHPIISSVTSLACAVALSICGPAWTARAASPATDEGKSRSRAVTAAGVGLGKNALATGYPLNNADAPPPESDTHYRFTTIDVPGAVFLTPVKLNNHGLVNGSFFDVNGVEAYGFILRRGRAVTVGFPNSTVSGMSTINDRGQLSGIYLDSLGNWHGFIATPEP